MSEPTQKKVDESWKEQVEREKQEPAAAPAAPSGQAPVEAAAGEAAEPAAGGPEQERGLPEARFDLFVSGLAMDALIALGDIPHPVTKKPMPNLEHARYLIDLLGVLGEKTRGNLSVDEERLLKDALYQLRTRYLAKSGG